MSIIMSIAAPGVAIWPTAKPCEKCTSTTDCEGFPSGLAAARPRSPFGVAGDAKQAHSVSRSLGLPGRCSQPATYARGSESSSA